MTASVRWHLCRMASAVEVRRQDLNEEILMKLEREGKLTD